MAAPGRRADEAAAGDVRCTSCESLLAENENLKPRLAEVEQAVEKLRPALSRRPGVVVRGGHGSTWCGAFLCCESCLSAGFRCGRPRPRPGLRARSEERRVGKECRL